MSAPAPVCQQQGDQRSSLSLYRRLLRLRKAEPALSMGSYVEVAHSESVLIYERQYEHRRLQVALNMSDKVQPLPSRLSPGKTLISTAADMSTDSDRLLRPDEGIIREVHSARS
jgi:alpha-glucosidase